MKKVQRKRTLKREYDKKTTATRNFLRRSRQLRQSTEVLRSKDNYTEVTLSTYQKFRMVIPNYSRRKCLAASSVDKVEFGSCIVYTQKFVCNGNHIDSIRFALRTLLVKICIDGSHLRERILKLRPAVDCHIGELHCVNLIRLDLLD